MTPLPSLKDEAWLNDPALKHVFAAIRKAGGEARVAGGAVRNALLGEAVNDIDLATTLPPEQVMAAAKAAKLGAHPTGIEHGTVTLVANRRPFEVTTLRRDIETFGRKARVAFTDDWTQDALRRDFTMNALYCSSEGEIFDPAKGYADILRKRIRFVGDPVARIKEDYLRILRFFRVHAYYGKGAMDEEGLHAAVKLRDGLALLSAERIAGEMRRILVAPGALQAVEALFDYGLLTAVLGGVPRLVRFESLAALEEANRIAPSAALRLAALAVFVTEDVERLAERLRLSKAEASVLDYWAGAPEIAPKLAETAFDRLLYRNGPQGLTMRLKLALAPARARGLGDPEALSFAGLCQRLLARAEKWRKPTFPLNGADVLAAGVPAGPKVGAVLGAVEDEWVAGNFHDGRAKLLARLEELATKD